MEICKEERETIIEEENVLGKKYMSPMIITPSTTLAHTRRLVGHRDHDDDQDDHHFYRDELTQKRMKGNYGLLL